MKLSTLGAIVPFLAALPTFSSTSPLASRATDGVYICAKEDWGGDCGWLPAWESETLCRGFPYPNSPYLSFGPDSGVTCTVFTDENCNTANDGTDSKGVSSPGDPAMPGPAYQGGQGTAHSPAYQAYKCHPMSSKRAIDAEGGDINDEKTKAVNDQIHNLNIGTATPRDAASLSLLAPRNPLDSRATDDLFLYTCSLPNWQGHCNWILVPAKDEGNAQCLPLPLPSLLSSSISFGPAKGVVCKVYFDGRCSATKVHGAEIRNPRFPELAAYATGPELLSATYKCWQGTPEQTTSADDQASEIDARTVKPLDDRVVYTCQFPDYQGVCDWIPVTAKDKSDAACNVFPFPMQSEISFGPDEGVLCNGYNGLGCYDYETTHVMQHPGSSSLLKQGGSVSSGLTRFKCWLM